MNETISEKLFNILIKNHLTQEEAEELADNEIILKEFEKEIELSREIHDMILGVMITTFVLGWYQGKASK